ncbi:MAG: monovalent cation/H+ antiporter complex subunit F [Candidatus Promineifilaceae bacterium]|nr:monovalent cation/H+ antiporter complex subunit F [Candidatus Promineifilaceae bacterium]
MEQIFNTTLIIALALHILMVSVAVWRVWRGENIIDRLIGVELVSTLFLAILVLVSLIYRDSIYLDVALVLGALGFVGTIALAKYVADEQMF